MGSQLLLIMSPSPPKKGNIVVVVAEFVTLSTDVSAKITTLPFWPISQNETSAAATEMVMGS